MSDHVLRSRDGRTTVVIGVMFAAVRTAGGPWCPATGWKIGDLADDFVRVDNEAEAATIAMSARAAPKWHSNAFATKAEADEYGRRLLRSVLEGLNRHTRGIAEREVAQHEATRRAAELEVAAKL